jgi:hypothetical protein
MFGFKHIKFDTMTYVVHYQNGNVKREGKGLSFFYFKPTSSIVAIPIASNDLPFIYNETSKDYQEVTIQGQISYRIKSPKKLAEVLDFTIEASGRYKKNDLEKLNQRIINEVQTTTAMFIQDATLKQAIRSGTELEKRIRDGISESEAIALLGVEILGVSVLAVSASPEMARALETETREKLQQEADQAIYERRNFAVEQERKIKESELNTEIAVEEKQRQIAEKKMESDVQDSENQRKLRELKMAADISIENERKTLLDQKASNDKMEADVKGYVLEATLKPYKELDWKVLAALNNSSDPKSNIALAFREMAENAQRIGNLNISPELLESILREGSKSD